MVFLERLCCRGSSLDLARRIVIRFHDNIVLVYLNEITPVASDGHVAVLNEANIEGRHLWKPMHSQPVFSHAKYVKAGEASVSEELFSRGICLPSDTKMSMDDVDHVCKVIREMF